jgi:hypothetical protein
MKRIMILALVGLSGCNLHGHSQTGDIDWRAQAIEDGEALVRKQINNPSLQFAHVMVTGDNQTGQACGYYLTPAPLGGTNETAFIYFIDGGGGQNPFIGDPSAPYPVDKSDFALNWREQCVDLGYHS